MMIKKPLQAIGLFCIALVSMLILLPATPALRFRKSAFHSHSGSGWAHYLYRQRNDTCTSISLLMGISEQDLPS